MSGDAKDYYVTSGWKAKPRRPMTPVGGPPIDWKTRALEAEELARDRKTTLETLGCSVHSTPLPDLDDDGRDLPTFEQGRMGEKWVNDREPKWISVKDRVPKNGQMVLCTNGQYFSVETYPYRLAEAMGNPPEEQFDCPTTMWVPIPALSTDEAGE